MPDAFKSAADVTVADLDKFHVSKFILAVPLWRSYKAKAKLNWTGVEFSQASSNKIPNDKKGVYTFVAQPGIADHPACSYLLYVGMVKDQNFRARFAQYLDEKKTKTDDAKRPHISQMLQTWDGHLWFYFAPLPKSAPVKKVEESLIQTFLPPFNRSFPATVRKAIKLVFK